MPKYYVYLYPVVRVKIEVEADSYEEALKKAEETSLTHTDIFQSTFPAHHHYRRMHGIIETESADALDDFAIVDVAGDEEYELTKSFNLDENGDWTEETF